MDKPVFSLRTPIRPGVFAAGDIDAAVDYALRAGMDDICMFVAGEESNDGFYTEAELQPWLQAAAGLREKALSAGLTFSLNPWNTLLHADRGRRLKPGQDFTRMTDLAGRQADAVSCPLCPQWRQWLLWSYRTLAEALTPSIIWVEDDFRLHNHDPLEWGGCFCGLHMEEYARRAGTPLTREDFLQGILQPGAPHPYRDVWLQTHRDTMNELAALLGETVRAVSPATRVALMSSVPAVHAAEGRDWAGILRGLSGPRHRPMDRIHLPAYSERWPGEYMRLFNGISMHTRACIPPDTDVLPELENYTFSRFIKSDAFTRFQVLAAAPLRLAGMTVDVFDIGGGGIFTNENDAAVLREARQAVAGLNGTGVFDSPAAGVQVLSGTRAAAFLHTGEGARMEELYPQETFWASLLGAMGIPFVHVADALPDGGVCAVSGQFFRGLSAGQAAGLFERCTVLMTGEAAGVLAEMGLGHLAGIKSCVRVPVNTGVASYEKVTDGTVVLGVREAHCSAQMMTGDYYRIRYAAGHRALSAVCNAKNAVQGPGVALCPGGRAAVLPYGRFGDAINSHLHPVRQALLQKALAALGQRLYVEDARSLSVYQYTLADGRTALYLVNASMDGCEWITLYTGGRAVLGAELFDGGAFAAAQTDGNRLRVSLPALGCGLLALRLAGG